MNTYITGTGQTLYKIHDPEDCGGLPCVIHNPSDHSMVTWPTHWRYDRGIMERICPEHGVGHPDPDDLSFRIRSGENPKTAGIHGCCGCCIEGEDSYGK